MFDNIIKFLKKFSKEEKKDSKDTAKERLHLVLMQDRANVSADFMELMKQEIIEVIKKYIDVDENSIDVKLTNKVNNDGTTGAPMLYANIPIVSMKEESKQRKVETTVQQEETTKKEEKVEEQKEERKPEEKTEKQEEQETEKKDEQEEKKEIEVAEEEKAKEQKEENENLEDTEVKG